ncbi:MAG: hypothetical protein C6Y22_30085 [Hapalosiphonaceae cyanobacterium JJU2]|nr:MAG: hypothetical protein C6Y22_30085 [Hapalosiphonaceae cyanobacterium JJU2]
MAITLENFCTKTGKPIIIDGKPITEKIEHCLAEYFAPNATFKLGTVYAGLTKQDGLKKFVSQGLSLQFAADHRFYFMDQPLREQIFDAPHFGAAYGSNMFTPCKSFSERKNLRVLVVDANTGENGGVMPNDKAIKLVGDGDGKIDAALHASLGNIEATAFQTRFGIKERRIGLDAKSATINTWQIGKGTFAPRDLSKVGNGYDLIISTDQLKGRRGAEERGNGEIRASSLLKPGEYLMTMGIGNKTDAYYGITSTGAQFWNLFPQGVEGDVLPQLQRRLEELKDIANDPRKIAQDYIDFMDNQYKYQIKIETESEEFIDFENLNLGELEKLLDSAFENSDQDVIYRILKSDLQGHYQLLEHPKIIDKLQQYWREQYMDCATGRFIKFDSAMAQTCHDLAPNEVCYPNFPDGAEVIVYRGPTANSNTVDVYINRHLPNEPLDIGTIKMSPKGLKHSLSDCDGDRMGIALASEFPHTAAEIKEKQLAPNRYAEIIKPNKKAYVGSFEQIALDAMENKIGKVANLCMKGIALENECVSIPPTEAWSLMRDISYAAVRMLAAENNQKKVIKYPDDIRKKIVELAKLCQLELENKTDIGKYNSFAEYNYSRNQRNLPLLSEDDVDKFLEKSRQFYHNIVGVLGGQLQIEVDRGKSANRSDPEIVNACNFIIKSFDIAPWVEERKVDEVYTTRPMKIKGHGAIDMMARMTNEAFAENALVARSTQQFQDFFQGVEFTSTQKDRAAQIKKTYDTLMNRAIEISQEVKEAPGPRIIATSVNGNKLEIVGLAEFKHPNAFDNKKLDIMIVENNNPSNQAKNKWIALAPVLDENGNPEIKQNGKPVRKCLGYISSESAKEHQSQIKQYKELSNLTPEVLPGLMQSHVRAAFQQVREFANTTRESIPDCQKETFAAAVWQISTANDREHGFKKTSAVFAIFGSELVERSHKLQFTEFAVVGTHKPSNEHLERKWMGEKVQCNIEQAADPANLTQNKRWLVVEGKKVGVFRSESAQLPIGTYFEAEITSPPSASVTITSTQGNHLKVGQLKKHAFSNHEWNGEEGIVTINVSGSGKYITPIAEINGKPLGVIDKESFSLLTAKLSEKGRSVQGFQFQATLKSAPATIANIKVDPETIRYPEVWTKEQPLVRDQKLSYLDVLKSLFKDNYKQKNNKSLLHDDEASLRAVLMGSEYYETLMQQKGKNAESFKALSEEIDKKFGVESFIGVAHKENAEELYFCVTVPTERCQQKTATRITDTLIFPLEYDQLENGQRTKFIAIPLDEMQELISQIQTKMQLHRDVVVAANLSISQETPNHKLNETATPLLPKDVAAVEVKRSRLEQNLINASFAAIQANSANQEAVLQTAPIASKYVAIYHTQRETLSILDDNQEIIYQATKNQKASINKLTPEHQEYWNSPATQINQQKFHDLTNSD